MPIQHYNPKPHDSLDEIKVRLIAKIIMTEFKDFDQQLLTQIKILLEKLDKKSENRKNYKIYSKYLKIKIISKIKKVGIQRNLIRKI